MFHAPAHSSCCDARRGRARPDEAVSHHQEGEFCHCQKAQGQNVLALLRPLGWGTLWEYRAFRHSLGALRKHVMTVSFEIPQDIEEQVRLRGLMSTTRPRGVSRRALSLDRITHCQFAEALGLNRFEADGVLKRHKVSRARPLKTYEPRSVRSGMRSPNDRCLRHVAAELPHSDRVSPRAPCDLGASVCTVCRGRRAFASEKS